MAIAAGVDAGELWRLISGNPGLVIGVPVTIVAYGFFTTMLPSGFSTISTLIIAPVLYAVFRAEATLLNLNFVMATGLATAIMLGLSLLTFLGDRTMSSPWRGVKGIAMLLAGIMLSLVGWSALNSAADHFWRIDVKESAEWLPMNDGKTIVWRVYSKTLSGCNSAKNSQGLLLRRGVFGNGDYLFKEASHSGRVLLLHDTASGLVKAWAAAGNVFKDSHNSDLVLAQIPEISFGCCAAQDMP